MSTRSKAVGVAGALLIAATSVSGVFASSHREAPLIAGDPAADNTDLYAFVSPTDPNKLTIIANYVPLEEPAGGPNFFPFDPAVRYEIHIDNNGDGKGDVTYSFRFHDPAPGDQLRRHPDIPLQRRPDHEPDRPEPARSADLRRLSGNDRKIASNINRRQPVNIGPRSTPDYAALAARRSPPSATAPRSSPASATTRSSSTSARSSTWPGSDRSIHLHAIPLPRRRRHRRRRRLQHQLDRDRDPDPDADQGSRASHRTERPGRRPRRMGRRQPRRSTGPSTRMARRRPGRPVAAGLATRQPADQRGRHPDDQEGLLEQPGAEQGLAVRQVLPGPGGHRGRQRPVRRAR